MYASMKDVCQSDVNLFGFDYEWLLVLTDVDSIINVTVLGFIKASHPALVHLFQVELRIFCWPKFMNQNEVRG